MDVIASEASLSGREYLGLHAAASRYGIPYTTLRGYVRSGLVKSMKTPNRRIWVEARAIEAPFEPVEANSPTAQGV